ncbi:hypothetical protein ES705_34812 [subsurface metagenome]
MCFFPLLVMLMIPESYWESMKLPLPKGLQDWNLPREKIHHSIRRYLQQQKQDIRFCINNCIHQETFGPLWLLGGDFEHPVLQ